MLDHLLYNFRINWHKYLYFSINKIINCDLITYNYKCILRTLNLHKSVNFRVYSCQSNLLDDKGLVKKSAFYIFYNLWVKNSVTVENNIVTQILASSSLLLLEFNEKKYDGVMVRATKYLLSIITNAKN